jgi:oligopeptide transport system substrate-binding protein
MKKVISLALAVIMTVGILSGCKSSGSGSSSGTGAANLTPIKICLGPEPASIDPAINQSADGGSYIAYAFEGLTKTDKNNNTVPGIASTWDISKDQLTYTFHLRTDAKWSDGKAVVAGDFVYAWQRAVNPQTASAYAYQLYYIKNAQAINTQYLDTKGNPAKVKMDATGKPVTDAKGNDIPDATGKYVSANADGSPIWLNDLGVKATDDHTLVVTLGAPCPYFLQIAGFATLDPVRKDIVDANPTTWATNPATYIGDGPYVLTSWKHNSEMDFVANPYYYDKKDIVGAPLDCLLMSDTNSILAAFKNGALDLVNNNYPTDELPSLVSSGQAKIYPLLAIYYYAFNDKVAPFNNVNVRKALTLAVDRNYIVNNIAKGGQKPASAMVPPGILDANGKSDFRADGGDFFDVSQSALAGNIKEAQQALADAGFAGGKDFPTIQIKYNTLELHQNIAEYIQAQWEKNLGINVDIVNEEWSVFQNDRDSGNFQVARDGWDADYADPMTFLDLFTSTSGNNDSHYSNPAYDKLIAGALSTGDQTTRMSDMHQAEKLLMNDYAAMPLYYYTNPDLISSKLKGFVSSPMGYSYFMWASMSK